MYIGAQDALVAFYPRLDDDVHEDEKGNKRVNTYYRRELDYVL
jgi:hypothetical protein